MLVDNMFIEFRDHLGKRIGGIAELDDFDATIGELLKTCTNRHDDIVIKLPGDISAI